MNKGTLVIVCSTMNVRYLLNACSKDETAYYHCRLGHMSKKGMMLLHDVGKHSGLYCVDKELSEECYYRKQKQINFTNYPKSLKKLNLELMHADVWGPTFVKSRGGALNLVVFMMITRESSRSHF